MRSDRPQYQAIYLPALASVRQDKTGERTDAPEKKTAAAVEV